MVNIQIWFTNVDRRGANMDVHGVAVVSGDEYETAFPWQAEDIAMDATAAVINAAMRTAAIDAAANLDPPQIVGVTDKRTLYGIAIDV
jgi:hypothetical protein